MPHIQNPSLTSNLTICPECNYPLISVPEPVAISTSILQLITTSEGGPRHDETLWMKTSIAADEGALQTIRASLDSLETMRQSLIIQEQAYTQRIEALRVASSPWRKVPNEILAEIFQLCSTKRKSTYYRFREKYTFPWSIGQVCHRWRAMVQSIPSLWHGLLDFKCMAPPQRNPEKLAIINSIVRFSGNLLPMKLALNIPKQRIRPNHPLIDSLIPHFTRISHLTIALFYQNREILSHISGHLQSLTTLHLSIYRASGYNVDPIFPLVPPVLKAFGGSSTPLLRHVRVLSHSSSTYYDQWLDLPWANLISFAGQGPRSDMFFVLKNAPLLERLEYLVTNNDTAKQLPSFQHDKLQQLHLYRVEYLFKVEIFSRLSLPGLVHLFFESVDEQPITLSALNRQFLTQSNCSLTSLDIKDDDIRTLRPSIFFVELSSLKSLYISWYPGIFLFLSTVTAIGLPLPHLTGLSISHVPASPETGYNSDIHLEQTCNFIDARDTTALHSLSNPLEFLSLEFDPSGCGYHETYFDRFDGWEGYKWQDGDRKRLREWVKYAGSSKKKKRPKSESVLTELMMMVAQLETVHGIFHPRCLHDTGAVYLFRQLYGALPLGSRTESMKIRLESWEHSVHDYLHSDGWMRFSGSTKYFEGIVYGKRQGSLDVEAVEPRHPLLEALDERDERATSLRSRPFYG